MGLAGWRTARSSRAEPPGFQSETRDGLEPQSSALGFPKTQGRGVPGGHTTSRGPSLLMTASDKRAAKWQVPKKMGHSHGEGNPGMS